MDPNSQIELELVPMSSDENLNNIQDDVNANFKPVRTSRIYIVKPYVAVYFQWYFRMVPKTIKNLDFVPSINMLIINQNQTIIKDQMGSDLDLNPIQLSNHINHQIRWDN